MCLLVEGYMDVVALHQSGIENVVASSGTSLTTEQIKPIKRLTENVTILFDGDAAGIKASFRSIDMLLAESMNIRILLFPEGHDPDSFARENSMEFVKNFIKENSKDFIDFKAIRDIVKSVAHVDNGLKQEIYLKQIATQFGLTERNLFDELQVQKQILKGQPQPKPKLEIVPKTEKKPFVDSDKTTGLLVLEEKLVELMLKYGDRILTRRDSENNSYQTTVIEEIIHHFQEDDCEILTETNRKIIDEVRQGLEQNEIRSGNFFFGLMDEDISGKIADALVENYETSDWKKFNIYFPIEEEVLGKVVRDVILRHKREYVMKLIEDLNKKLDEMEEKTEIYEQIVRLNQLKIKIDQKLFRIL